MRLSLPQRQVKRNFMRFIKVYYIEYDQNMWEVQLSYIPAHVLVVYIIDCAQNLWVRSGEGVKRRPAHHDILSVSENWSPFDEIT